MPNAKQGQEARIDAPKTTDAVQTADAVVNKFQSEAGMFASGDPRALSARRETGAPLVDSRMQSFETGSGVKAGMVHSGTDGTFLTTNQGERYGITTGTDGRRVLTNAEGQSTEVIRTTNEINQVNRPTTEVGNARVHMQGQGVETHPQGKPTVTVAETAGEGQTEGRFNRREFRESLKALESNPGDRQAQRHIQETMRTHPQEANRVIQQMDQNRQQGRGEQPGGDRGEQQGRNRGEQPGGDRGEQQGRNRGEQQRGDRGEQPGGDRGEQQGRNRGEQQGRFRGDQQGGDQLPGNRGEQGAREGQRVRGEGQVNIEGRQRGQQGELPAELAEQMKNLKGQTVDSNLTKADLQKMGDGTTGLKEMLTNPESQKAMQKLFEQGRDGKVSITDNLEGGKGLDQGKGKAALDAKQAVNGDALAKQMGLDLSNPATRTFLFDLGKRMQTLQQGETGNIKITDMFKGLDPVQARTLQNFLTRGNPLGGDMTLSQVDPSRMQSLKMLLDGQLRPQADLTLTYAKQGGLSRVLSELANRPPSSLDAPTGKAFGQNLLELGKALNSADGGSLRLIDGTLRTPGPLEMTAKLTTPQEQLIKTLIENSGKLANLIETGKINLGKGDIARLDPSLSIISDIVTRLPGSMQGSSFVVRGEVLGNLGAIEAAQQFIRGDAAAASGLTIITRPDGSQVVQSPSEILSGKPIDPVSGLPYDPYTGKLLDPTNGRVIGQIRPGEPGTKPGEKWEDRDDKRSDRRKFEEEKEVVDKKKAAILAAKMRKLKELKEKELKDKVLKEEERRKEDKKRIKYIVREGDTLESIAQKQLRDLRLAPLIYRINKKVIPIVNEGGKEVIALKKGLVLWLPSPFEAREFRTQLGSGVSIPGAASNTAFSGKKYASPEEELAAKFGANWASDDTSNDPTSDTKDSIAEQMLLNALEEQKRRQDNIEKVLGPVSTTQKTDSDRAGRTLYTVRLGDSLKTVAMKHPLIRDISLWKLVAEVNKLPITTDRTGRPTATLTRGNKIKIPTIEEIVAYKDKIGVTKGFSPDVEKHRPATGGDVEMHICEKCGRMSASTAKLCGCGQKISAGEKSSKESTPETIPTKIEAVNEEKLPAESTELNKEEVEVQLSFDQVEDFDSMTRLIKTNQTQTSPMKYSLQVLNQSQWTTLITYEIGSSKTLRHDEFSGNTRKTVKIDLPGKAAEELAKNDLTGNWKNYKRKFLRGHVQG